MASASLVPLRAAMRRAVQRDDRPGRANALIFAISLTRPANSPSVMKIMGPATVRFEIDCLPSVATSNTSVFGATDPWPSSYDAFEDGVRVTKCEAKVPNIALLDVTAGLLAGKKYAFRIGLAANPQTTPYPNQWTIEFAEQASLPFDGFILWTFTDWRIAPVTTAVQLPSSESGHRQENLVAIVFRPFSAVEPPVEGRGGELHVVAPVGFEVVHMNLECRVAFFEQAFHLADAQTDGPDFSGIGPGAVQWGDSDLACSTDTLQLHSLLLTFTSSRYLQAGTLYRLVMRAYNPFDKIPAGTWRLSSFAAPHGVEVRGIPLDDVEMPGFKLTDPALIWEVLNKHNIVHGSAPIEDVGMRFAMPRPLAINDRIIVIAPPGFDLGMPDGSCTGLRWDATFSWDPENNMMRTCPFCKCKDNRMTMTVNMLKSKEFDVKIKFTTTNLERTPPSTNNYWIVKHRRASDGRILGSAAQEGWTIIPQLEHVSIKLTGSRKAAQSYSELLVRFTPVNKADVLVIQVTEPLGFDFTWTELRSAGQWITDAAGPQIRLNFDATPGEEVVVQMEGVQLGKGGGLTLVKLTSYLHGVRKDERIDFPAFDLPGLITACDCPP
jgi:hypothetical protein